MKNMKIWMVSVMLALFIVNAGTQENGDWLTKQKNHISGVLEGSSTSSIGMRYMRVSEQGLAWGLEYTAIDGFNASLLGRWYPFPFFVRPFIGGGIGYVFHFGQYQPASEKQLSILRSYIGFRGSAMAGLQIQSPVGFFIEYQMGLQAGFLPLFVTEHPLVTNSSPLFATLAIGWALD